MRLYLPNANRQPRDRWLLLTQYSELAKPPALNAKNGEASTAVALTATRIPVALSVTNLTEVESWPHFGINE